MSTIVNTGSTLKSNTYEGCIDELCSLILIAQKLATTNPDNVLLVSTTTDSLSGQVTYEINIPLQSQPGAGTMGFSVTNPLIILPWVTGGDITAPNAVQQLFNLLVQLETFESLPNRNAGNESRLQVDIQSSPWRCVVGLNLQATFSLTTAGGLTRTVQAYLT